MSPEAFQLLMLSIVFVVGALTGRLSTKESGNTKWLKIEESCPNRDTCRCTCHVEAENIELERMG